MQYPRDRRKADRVSRDRRRKIGPLRVTFKTHSARSCIYPLICPLYAAKGGGPVLRDQGFKWTYFNGFLLHTRTGHVTITFRRGILE